MIRYWKKLTLLSITLLLVGLIAAPFALAQTSWYLTDNFINPQYEMFKGSPSGGSAQANIDQGLSVIWIANEAASTNVTFPAATWDGYIKATSQTGSDATLNVEIGTWNGSFTPSGTGEQSADLSYPKAQTTTNPFSINASSFSVPLGQYLALRINCTVAKKITYIETDGGSYVNYPNPSPAYPVPDVETLILFAAGMVIVAIVFWKVRKRQSASQTTKDL